MAQLVDDVQIQEFVRGATQVRQANGNGSIVVVYVHLVGLVNHKHFGVRHDPIDFFRVGKDGGQNTIGADIGKNFRQSVLSGFKPAMDAKHIFHPDCLTSLTPHFSLASSAAFLKDILLFHGGSISRTSSYVNQIGAANRGRGMNAVTEPVMDVVMDQGVYRFVEKSLHPEAICREILDDLSLFVGQNEQSDDIMMLALSFHGREPQGA
jgi:hypothetical protein